MVRQYPRLSVAEQLPACAFLASNRRSDLMHMPNRRLEKPS